MFSQPDGPTKTGNDAERATEEEEVFLTACDLTVSPAVALTQVKGCVIRNNTIFEDDSDRVRERKPLWRKILCCNCKPCSEAFKDLIWMITVRCARVAPRTYRCCYFIDSVSLDFKINMYLLDCKFLNYPSSHLVCDNHVMKPFVLFRGSC